MFGRAVLEPVCVFDTSEEFDVRFHHRCHINGVCEVDGRLYILMTGWARGYSDRLQSMGMRMAAIDAAVGTVVQRWNVCYGTYNSRIGATSKGSFWCLVDDEFVEFDLITGRRLRAFYGFDHPKKINATDTAVYFAEYGHRVGLAGLLFWRLDLRDGKVTRLMMTRGAYSLMFPKRPDAAHVKSWLKRVGGLTGNYTKLFGTRSGGLIVVPVHVRAQVTVSRVLYRVFRFYWMLLIARRSSKI